MASRAWGVLQDQNLKIDYSETSGGWKTNFSKEPRKGVLGGRTPLGDLSNAIKPSPNLASKKQNSSIFSFTEKESGASQNSLNATKKNSASSKAKTAGRKALSDISNSGKPKLNEGPKKNISAKLDVVTEEQIDADTIAEEQFLHNHQACIEARTRAMDLDEVLETLGLNNDFSKQHSSPMAIEVQSPPRYFQLEEIAEEPITEDESWKIKLPSELDSPLGCGSPISPKFFMDRDCNLELLESPKLLRH